jgi:hypothetical protein
MGDQALPIAINPYLQTFGRLEPVAGAILPTAGTYDVVFDTPSAARAGAFSFRFWIDDTTPPSARLVSRSTSRGGTLAVRVADTGSGVAPETLAAHVDGSTVPTTYSPATGIVSIRVPARFGPGSHRLELEVSDYQEEKNTEDVGPILPNTRTLRATFSVR